MNSDQCLFPFPLPIVFIFLTKPLGSTCGAHIRNVIISAKQLSQRDCYAIFHMGDPNPPFSDKELEPFSTVFGELDARAPLESRLDDSRTSTNAFGHLAIYF